MLHLNDSGIHSLDLQGSILQVCLEQSESLANKHRVASTPAIEHSCRADRVLSWDSVNVSSVSDCILMKIFYISAECPNCNVTRQSGTYLSCSEFLQLKLFNCFPYQKAIKQSLEQRERRGKKCKVDACAGSSPCSSEH